MVMIYLYKHHALLSIMLPLRFTAILYPSLMLAVHDDNPLYKSFPYPTV